jgi:GDP-L-fucose synthase
MNIVLTGGSGFLLSNLQMEYNADYIAPRSSEVNWITGEGINTLPNQPDVFIHSAAIYGGLVFNQQYPERILLDNMRMSINVFDYILTCKPKKVIIIGSACSYPGNATGVLTENMIGSGRMERTVELYAMNKLWQLAASERLLPNWTHLVLANMYGPNDHLDLEKAHVVGALMKKICNAKRDGTDVQLLGTGEPLRSLVYVKDVCAVIDYFINNDVPNGAYNIGHDKGLSIRTIAEAIAQTVGYTGNILWGDAKDNGAMVKILDYTKLDTIFPDRPKTDLSKGLQKAVEQFL